MILSHKNKFIFIKTNKTAGTSIEIALSKFCGPDDIITPVNPEDEEIRRSMGFPGPQNYLSPMSGVGLCGIAKEMSGPEKKSRFYNHMNAKAVKALIKKEEWESYFKFCFERNPWDRVISLYYWRYKSEPRPTISQFVNSDEPLRLKKKGRELYTIDGKIVVDRICRFENLANELEVVRKHVGIPEPLELPMAKSSFRKDKRCYRDILGDEDKVRIMKLFRDEIDILGYEY